MNFGGRGVNLTACAMLPMQPAPFFMRAMLVANIDVPNRFANGTQGRIVGWSPDIDDRDAAAVSAAFKKQALDASQKKGCCAVL